MKILSLFDGMSGGMLALNALGVVPEVYYASEVDKTAIAESKANFPDIIQLGDVSKWQEWDIQWEEIDLLIGGSPCQGFSTSGKQLNFSDPRSKLFFTYVDILNHLKAVNPEIKFMLENVKMKRQWEQVITNSLGVDAVAINSADFTAHNRQRLYWFNWDIPSYTPTTETLKDALESGYVDREKSYCIDANYWKGGNPDQYFNKSRRQLVFDHYPVDKEAMLSLPKGIRGLKPYRKLTVKECCRLQGVPEDFFKVSSNTECYKMLGNGWTIPVIAHILKATI